MKTVEFEDFKVTLNGNGAEVSATIKDREGFSDSELEKIVEGILEKLTGISIMVGSSNIFINGNVLRGHR